MRRSRYVRKRTPRPHRPPHRRIHRRRPPNQLNQRPQHIPRQHAQTPHRPHPARFPANRLRQHIIHPHPLRRRKLDLQPQKPRPPPCTSADTPPNHANRGQMLKQRPLRPRLQHLRQRLRVRHIPHRRPQTQHPNPRHHARHQKLNRSIRRPIQQNHLRHPPSSSSNRKSSNAATRAPTKKSPVSLRHRQRPSAPPPQLHRPLRHQRHPPPPATRGLPRIHTHNRQPNTHTTTSLKNPPPSKHSNRLCASSVRPLSLCLCVPSSSSCPLQVPSCYVPSLRRQCTRCPAFAPESGDNTNTSAPPGPAAQIHPLARPKFPHRPRRQIRTENHAAARPACPACKAFLIPARIVRCPRCPTSSVNFINLSDFSIASAVSTFATRRSTAVN